MTVPASKQPQMVSVHGGHSGQFCSHAYDQLEPIVQEYVRQGFAWVGLTEHMPPAAERFIYPDEAKAGLDTAALYARFADYFAVARQLQANYAADLPIFVGFEGETYSGSFAFMKQLIADFEPDYIVGSVHHLDDVSFDLTPDHYARCAAEAGSLEAMYCRYFDLQYEMIAAMRPQVVAHFDYIRIFDPDYQKRLQQTAVWQRIQRNLALVQKYGLILDFNVKALRIGQPEPYLSQPILQAAKRLGIAIVPGDDSHGVTRVGGALRQGIEILQAAGVSTAWRTPIS